MTDRSASAQQILAVAAEALEDDQTVLGVVVITLRQDDTEYHSTVLTNMSADETANLMGNQALRLKRRAAQ